MENEKVYIVFLHCDWSIRSIWASRVGACDYLNRRGLRKVENTTKDPDILDVYEDELGIEYVVGEFPVHVYGDNPDMED